MARWVSEIADFEAWGVHDPGPIDQALRPIADRLLAEWPHRITTPEGEGVYGRLGTDFCTGGFLVQVILGESGDAEDAISAWHAALRETSEAVPFDLSWAPSFPAWESDEKREGF